MKCDSIRPLLLDWAYGVLEDEESLAIEQHAADCPACQTAMILAKDQKNSIRSALVDAWPEVEFRSPKVSVEKSGQVTSSRRNWVAFCVIAAVVLLQVLPLGYFLGGLSLWGESQKLGNLAKSVEKSQKDLQDNENRLQEAYLTARAKVENEYRGLPKTSLTWEPKSEKGHTSLGLSGGPSDRTWKGEWIQDGKVPLLEGGKSGPEQKTVVPGPGLPKSVLKMEWKDGETTHRAEITLNNWVTFLQLDKTHYRPGELVRFRSITLNREDQTPIRELLSLRYVLVGPQREIEVARGNGEIRSETGESLKRVGGDPIRGLGFGMFSLPSDISPAETWKLEVRDALNRFAPVSQEIVWTNRDASGPTPVLRFDQSHYQPGDPGKATLIVPGEHGKKLAGQKVTFTFSYGGQIHLADGTPSKRNRTEKVVPAEGNLTIDFQVPSQVQGEQHELIVQIPGESGFSTILAPIPLFTVAPQVIVQPLPPKPGSDLHRTLVWSLDSRGRPAPLKATWRSKKQPQTFEPKPLFPEFPLGLFLVETPIPLGPDWELELVGPGFKQVVDHPPITEPNRVVWDPHSRFLGIRGSTKESLDWKLLKRGRILAQGQLMTQPGQTLALPLSKEIFSSLGGGICQVILQPSGADKTPVENRLVVLGPVLRPEITVKSTPEGHRFFLHDSSGKTVSGLGMAMVYLEGSEWGEIAQNLPGLAWEIEATCEGQTLPEPIREWVGRLSADQAAIFLGHWFNLERGKSRPLQPNLAQEQPSKPLRLGDPFRAPFVEQLSKVARDLDEQWESAFKEQSSLETQWRAMEPQIGQHKESLATWKNLTWGLWTVPLFGLFAWFWGSKHLSRVASVVVLVLAFAPTTLAITMAVALPNAATLPEIPVDETTDNPNAKPTLSLLSTKSNAQAEGVNIPTPGGVGNPSGPPKRQNKTLAVDPPATIVESTPYQSPLDDPDTWPKPRFLEKRDGQNQPDAGSRPMLDWVHLRSKLGPAFTQAALIAWDPCLILSEQGCAFPKLDLAQGERARIFALVVSDHGGLGLADLALPQPPTPRK